MFSAHTGPDLRTSPVAAAYRPTRLAITGNVTVVNQTAGGYRRPSGPRVTDNPTTSTVNFPLGDTRANGITVRLAGDGSLSAIYVAPLGREDAPGSST